MRRGAAERLRAHARAALELCAWWRTELHDMGQALVRRLPTRRSPEVRLRVGAGAISVERRDGAEWKVVGTAPLQPDGSWPSELPGLPAELRGARTIVALDPSDLFFDDLELPLAAERHLSSVLRLQLERRLPVPLDDLAVDRQLGARDRQRETLRVSVVVAHRARVEAARETAAAWGLAPVGVGVLGDNDALQFNLLRRRRNPIRWTPTPLDLRLARVAAASLLILTAIVGVQWVRERAVVRAESAQMHAQAQQIAALRAKVIADAEPLAALRGIDTAVEASELLALLSASVPNSAWFRHIDLATPIDASGTIKLIGNVTTREEVVEALRTLPGVTNIKSVSAFNGEILGRDLVEFSAEFKIASAGVTR